MVFTDKFWVFVYLFVDKLVFLVVFTCFYYVFVSGIYLTRIGPGDIMALVSVRS